MIYVSFELGGDPVVIHRSGDQVVIHLLKFGNQLVAQFENSLQLAGAG
jgi:hypothetical protein